MSTVQRPHPRHGRNLSNHPLFVVVHRLCIIAGDISPIDVISHVPIMCEDAGIPYCYVSSKQELGAAGSTKRTTSVVLCLGTDAENAELRDECIGKVKEMPVPH
jgi:H/ACA ribonucleoprotein complex subunit 2